MKKIIILILFMTVQTVLAQKLNIKSERISLDIKYPPIDSIAPDLTITSPLPNIIKGLPVYQRDSIAIITGTATDNVKVDRILN